MNQSDRDWVESRALNVIGHELRTPASTVRGLAEVLAVTDDPATLSELMPALLRNAQRLEALVDDLLTATQVVTALPVGPAADLDVVEAIRAAWGPEPGLEGEDPPCPTTVRARPDALQRIFAAVMGNARIYGERPVRLGLRVGEGVVRVAIESPGPPLSEEDVRLAMQPFWRGERAVTTTHGLGLGLAVAGVLAEHEGGRVWVRAGDSGGLITFVELPAA